MEVERTSPESGHERPLWTRDFLLLTAGNFAIFLGFYVLLPTLPIYVIEAGGSQAEAGLTFGLFTVSSVLIRPVSGWAIDRLGRRRLIGVGVLLFAVTALLYQWAAVVLVLLALRFLHGFSWGLATTGLAAAAADLIPKRRLAEGTGYFGMAATVAMGLAPAAGLAIIGSWGFTPLFLFTLGMSLAALLLTMLVRYPAVERGAPRGIVAALFCKEALRPSLTGFFATMTYGVLLAFVALHAADQGVANAGLFFMLYAVVLTLVRPFAGRIADRMGYERVIVPALVVVAATMVVLSLAGNLPAFLLAAVLYGVGFGSLHPTLQALAVLGVAPDRRGAASATFFSAFDLGITAGATLGGLVAGWAGYGSMFLIAAGPALAGLVLFLALPRLQRRPAMAA